MITPFRRHIPRGPLVFVLGLLISAAMALSFDGALARVALQTQIPLTEMEDLPEVVPSDLTLAERRAAETAWTYIHRNTQAETGWVNSVDGFASTTLWDQGSYLLGLVSAVRLQVIDEAEFDRRMTGFLTTLDAVDLFDGRLPNKVYHTQTLALVNYANEEVPGGIGWSALDLGRFLMALRVVEKHYPEYGDQIRKTLSRWDLRAMASQGELWGSKTQEDGYIRVQEGRIGYEQYGARAAALWGLDVLRAVSAERIIDWREIEGVGIPTDLRRASGFGAITPVVSEPFILMGLEMGFDSESATLAALVLQAQEARYAQTDLITMVSEDHVDEAPHFLYASVFANGRDWGVVTEEGSFHPELRTQSTKASFAWHALLPSDYTQLARDAVMELADDRLGFAAGIYETTGEPNLSYTLNTNAIVLEALHYQVFGPLWSAVGPN